MTQLRNVNWTPIYRENDIDIAYNIFYDLYFKIYNNCFPEYEVKNRGKSKDIVPYMTEALSKSIKESKRLHRLSRKWPISYRERYIKYNSVLKNSLKLAEQLYFTKTLKSNQGNAKKTWETINIVLKRTKSRDSCKIEAPSNIENVPNYINDYFLNGIDKLKENRPDKQPTHTYKDYLSPSVNFSLFAKPISDEEIIEYCNSIKTSAIGCDDINPNVFKRSIHIILKPLKYLMQLSFKTGEFPKMLKIAKVIPIHKSGDKTDIKNKRPISILSVISKIFERAMYSRLSDYFERYNLLTPHQHGFRKNFSTESATLSFTNYITKALNNNEYAIGVFLDFSKAFDCIEHEILINKLENMGVRGIFLNLIADYLAGREQRVFYDNKISDSRNIKYGVPQGTILGPLLFAVYVNDVVNVSIELLLALYADDKSLCMSDKNPYNLIQRTNVELSKIYEWVVVNKLCLNMLKTFFIMFSKNNFFGPLTPLLMGNHSVERVYHTKFLGIVLDYKLTWENHIDYLCNRLSKVCGIMYITRNFLTKEAMLSIYYGLFYSLLTYGINIWGGACLQYLDRIYLVQKKVLTCYYLYSKI